VVNPNTAIDSLPALKILVGIIALFEQIYDKELILTLSGGIYNTAVSVKCMM
jgi:hypothetical protein